MRFIYVQKLAERAEILCMRDRFGREIDYMRISVTERCCLRCYYCMPEEGIETVSMSEILTYEEIYRVCKQAAELGIQKIKITGGEPLVRKGVSQLVGMVRRIPDITSITMTTNGVLLEEQLEELVENGLDAVNISLDTLNARQYAEITRRDKFEQVMRGIEAALEAGIKTKINAVIQEGTREQIESFAMLAKERPLDVRFIEIMPIGMGRSLETLSGDSILKELCIRYPDIQKDDRIHGNGPAEYYQIDGFVGSIGFIRAVHGKFCDRCNRIRLSATGLVKPCLCYATGLDVREALRSGRDAQVKEILKTAILAKPEAHCFEHMDEISERKEMAAIGG